MITNSILQPRPPLREAYNLVQSIDRPYAFKVASIRPGNLIRYIPLWEPSGLQSNDWSLMADHAVNVGLGVRAAGPEGYHQAPAFNATPSHINLLTTPFIARFNGSEGTLAGWAKAASAGQWADGLQHDLVYIIADGNNRLIAYAGAGVNHFALLLECSGSFNYFDYPGFYPADNWFMYGLTWSKAANELKGYYNGAQLGVTRTIVDTFTGSLTVALLGAEDIAATHPWLGSMAHVALWNTPLTASEMQSLAEV